MRVAFAGTPEFAAVGLRGIVDAGFDVPLVLTQPDRPAGRGLREQPGPVKRLAQSLAIPVLQPATLKTESARAPLLAQAVDVLVVAAYGLILPEEILAWPRHGCLNIHASLLPRWRGAAPIQRALLAGDRRTGVCIMQMDRGLDTGPVIATRETAIASDETSGSLHDRLARLGAEAIVDVLRRLDRDGTLSAVPQPEEGATYAGKLTRADALIDWRASAEAIDRRVRALAPSPGALTALDGEPLKIWSAEPVAAGAGADHALGAPGEVVRADASGIWVACGEGLLRVRTLQRPGGKRLEAGAFVAGGRLAPGMRLGADDRSAQPGSS